MRQRWVGGQMFTFYRRIGADRFQEQHGLAFEDFAPGQRFRHRPGMTVSQQDNADEALDTLNGAMLHFDAHYAAATAWRRPLIVSTLTLQRVIGMASKTFARRSAILEFPEIVLNGPVFGGDTLYAESEVLACDAADASVTVRLRGVKSDGAEIGRFICRMAIGRRDDGETAGEPRFAAYHMDAGGILVEQSGLFFEDLRAGETFIHAPRRSFFAEEVVGHAWRSLEVTPRYHDVSVMQGRVPVAEPFLIGVVTALTTRVFGRVSANLGWRGVALSAPVFAGDTIEAESTILDARESRSRPDEGVVSVATVARNQRGDAVLRFNRTLLVYRRSASGLYGQVGY